MDDREKKTKELKDNLINIARIAINKWFEQRKRGKNV